jgi:hypothetical protein
MTRYGEEEGSWRLRALRAEAREKELREALNRMLVSFAPEDELCMECGEKYSLENGDCESCYVISKTREALGSC